MKKLVAFVLLILFAAYGAIAYSQEPSPPSTEGQPWIFNPQASTQRDIKPKYGYDITVNTISSPDKVKAGKTNDPAENAKNKNNDGKPPTVKDDPIARYTFWLMIFTGCLAFFNIALWSTTKDAADAAKKSADALPAVERAYVFVEIKPLTDVKDWNTITINACVSMKNYGKTPAILNNVCGVINLRDARVNEALGIQVPPGIILSDKVDETNPCPFNILSIHLRENEYHELWKERIPAYCCGKVKYEDIFHQPHETGFCWEYRPGDGDTPTWAISSRYKELNYYT